MKIALTANGPGEVAGWVRPLLRAIYARDPQAEIHIFCVPDDYATGFEAQTARTLFPDACVYDPRTYVSAALGRAVDGLPRSVNVVQYLGGDLMHAARLQRRMGGALCTYKFARAADARRYARAFAIDEANAQTLRRSRVPPNRVRMVGNLAIDGALIESRGPVEVGAPEDGVLFMPGSRSYEVEQLIPFFFTAAMRMRAENPAPAIAFGISPFTPLEQVRAAIEAGGDPRVFAVRGRVLESGGRAYLASQDGNVAFPVVRNALSAATVARLAVTLPGTKAIELATLGVPTVACSPLNAPEMVTINGPLTYLDRLPLVGVPLKRAIVTGVSRRHRFHTQPNIDAGEMLIHELHGALTPGRVARVALERFSDTAWLHETAARLARLYQGHAGAAERMAGELLALHETEH